MTTYKFPSSRVSPGALKELILCSILQTLAIIAVCLRLWSRRMKRKRLAFNDYAIVGALIFCTGLLAIAIISSVWSGKGFHTLDIDPRYRSRIFVTYIAAKPVWAAANLAVKLSVLHFYLTVFPDHRFRRVAYATMIWSVVYFVAVIPEGFLACKPVQFNWDKTIEGGTCSKHTRSLDLAAGAINFIVDLLISVMPIPVLSQLHICRQKKLGLIAAFSVGGIICIASLLRVIYTHKIDPDDFSYTYRYLAIWSLVEPQLGVINACLLLMRPVLQRVLKSRSKESFVPVSGQKCTDTRHFKRMSDTEDALYPLDTDTLDGATIRVSVVESVKIFERV